MCYLWFIIWGPTEIVLLETSSVNIQNENELQNDTTNVAKLWCFMGHWKNFDNRENKQGSHVSQWVIPKRMLWVSKYSESILEKNVRSIKYSNIFAKLPSDHFRPIKCKMKDVKSGLHILFHFLVPM